MADIVLKNKDGTTEILYGLNSVKFVSADDSNQLVTFLVENGYYTIVQIDELLRQMSDLLVGASDFASLVAALNTLHGTETEFSGFGAHVVAVDKAADILLDGE